MVDTDKLLDKGDLTLSGSDAPLDFSGKASPKNQPRNFSLNPGAMGAGMAPKSENMLISPND